MMERPSSKSSKVSYWTDVVKGTAFRSSFLFSIFLFSVFSTKKNLSSLQTQSNVRTLSVEG